MPLLGVRLEDEGARLRQPAVVVPVDECLSRRLPSDQGLSQTRRGGDALPHGYRWNPGEVIGGPKNRRSLG